MARNLLTKKQKRQLLYAVLSIILAGAIWLGQRQGWIDELEQENIKTEQTDTTPEALPGLSPVVSVVDGDTIKVKVNGTEETVRLIGVDTPETKDPRKPVECFGQAASDFTKNLIGDNQVRLENDPTNSDRDRYDRILRYVYLPDGTLVNSEIIKQGYGFAYTSFPFQKIDEFKKLEADAEAQSLGLWGSCNT